MRKKECSYKKREEKKYIIKHKSYETRIEKLNYVYYETQKKLNCFQVIFCELYFSCLEKKASCYYIFFIFSK